LLNLAYKPAAVGAGVLRINYTYTDNGGAPQKSTATINYVSTSNNNVIATAAPAGQIIAMVGHGSQAVAVGFTTDDGNPATALTLTTDLTSLPSGWTSTATSFACDALSSGNGCQLPLTYAPPAIASGTLTLNYSYKDNSGDSKAGTIALSYVATDSDNVVGTVSPSGHVVSVLGSGTQAVTVTFTTDDGNAATAMSLTSALSALPSGWTSSASGLTCAIVSAGNGCQLPLSFAPVSVGSGTLALNYAYTDVGGTAKTGTVNVPYAGTIHDNVVGTASPSGQVTAVVGGGTQAVQITFTTDDGNLATGVSISTDLGSLPAGWHSSVPTFACAHASSGATCQLVLTYSPTAVASGTLTLQYTYVDNAGTTKTAVVTIPYSATVHDNVVYAAFPSGQISGAIGDSAHSVTVTFATDDGNAATALSITSNLSALPSGWSASAGSFTCATVSTGTGCQLSLSFTPAPAAAGTLALSYGYMDNVGTAKTGTVNIAYVSTSHNTMIATPTPGGTIRIKPGSSAIVELVFTTDDGNTATGLAITSNLAALPDGWSGANGFTCGAVSSGTSCELPLTYAPTTNASGTLAVNFSYLDSAGAAKAGSAALVYSNPHLYIYDYSNGVEYCTLNLDDSLNTCTATAAGVTGLYGRGAFSANNAFIPDNTDGAIFKCALNLDGTLTGCANSGISISGSLYSLSAVGSDVYAVANAVNFCVIGAGGNLTSCAPTAINATHPYFTAATASHVYVSGNALDVCDIAGDGSLINCVATGSVSMSNAEGIIAAGSYLYGASGAGVTSCRVGVDGTLSSCTDYTINSNAFVSYDVAVDGTTAWVLMNLPTVGGTIYRCTVDPGSGALSNCAITTGNLTSIGGYAIAFY
jgi:hypothetical protein